MTMSKNDDLVRRLRRVAERYEHYPRMTLAADIREAADAIERGAAQVSVTDEMVREARQELGRRGVHIGLPLNDDERNEAMRAALEAAFDTLPAPAPDAGEDKRLDHWLAEKGALPARCSPYALQPPAVEAEADGDVKFLLDAAKYFAKQPTNGEDMVHWSHVQNAGNLRRIAAALKAKTDEIERLRRERDYAWERMKNADAYWRVETHHAEQAEARAEAAEASNKALREKVEKVIEDMPESYYRTQLAAALRALRGEGGVDDRT